MIQFANNLLKGRSLYSSKTKCSHYIRQGQGWAFRSKNMFYSSSLKFSTFSDYMGLTQQFKQFCQNEEKVEKSEIRNYSILIIMCITVIGYGSLFLFYDKLLNQKIKLMKLKLKMTLNSKGSRKHELHSQYLKNISQFLKSNPYEYAEIIQKIYDILTEAGSRNQQALWITEQVKQIYKTILQHNFKAANNKKVIEGLAKLVEYSILNGTTIDNDLIMAIVLNGQVKQIFLGILYLQKHKKIEELKSNTKIKEDISNNLKKQIHAINQYFDHLDKSRDLSELPQLEFKQQQQQKWQRYIQAQLDIQQ